MYLRTERKRNTWIVVVVLVAGVAAAWAAARRFGGDPDEVWREAEAHIKANRLDQAEATVTRLGRLRSPTPIDWMLRAQVATGKGRHDDAIACLARVPDDYSGAGQARLLAGQIELRRGRMRPAEALLLAASRIDPKLIQPHRELVYIYGMQSRRRDLSAQFRVLSTLTPLTFDNVFHWCLTRNAVWEPVEIVESMTRFLEADPGDRWSRLALVDALRQLGRLDEADKALSALPQDDPDARAARVRMALARGDDRAAEALLSDGPADHPDIARLRGRFAMAHGDPKSALRFFRSAYAIEPDDRDTLFGLAGALTMLGDFEAAKPFQTLARDHDRLGSVMQLAATPNQKKDASLLRKLGSACEAIHRLPEARAWYNLAIGLDPLDSEAQQALFRVDAGLSKALGRSTAIPPSPSGRGPG